MERRAYVGLNDEQRAAASADAATPLLILAGAGSGKTKTMVRRCVFFVTTGVCAPEEILALTFTRGAATEMDERLRRELRIATSAKGPTACTFHKLALDICRAHITGPGFTRDFTVWTDVEQRDVVLDYIRVRHAEDGLEPRAILRVAGRVQRALALRRSMAWDGDACEQTLRDGDKALLDDLYDHYEATLRRCNALDIAGFVLKAIELLEADCALRRRWRARFPVLLVDEFQDTSRAQLALLTLLAGGREGSDAGGGGGEGGGGAALPPAKRGRSSITVVGDENQSIYAFSGASAKNFALFEHSFSPIRIVTLRRNYRSSANVVQVAEAIVRPLALKSRFAAAAAAWTTRSRGAPVRVREARSAAAEMAMLVATLRERRGERGAPAQRAKWAQSAVLFRTNAVGVEVEEALRAACIPFARAGRSCGVDEAQRGDVHNFLSLLRFLVSPRDDVAFKRVVERVLRVRLAPSALELVRRTARALEGSLCDAARAVCAAPCKAKLPPPPTAPPPLPVARKRARQYGARPDPPPNAAPNEEGAAAGNKQAAAAAAAAAPPPPRARTTKSSKTGAAVAPLSKAERRDLAAAIAQIDRLRTRMVQLTLHCFVQRCVQHFPRLTGRGAASTAASASASASGTPGSGAAPTFAAALLREAHAFAGGGRVAASAAPLAAAAARERFARFVEHITLSIDGAAFGRAATGVAAARATLRDAVWIGTVHQAKGLEWPFTAVVRMNEGVFPLRDMRPGAPLPSARRTAEERRLCYVAFSRARQELVVSYVALSVRQQAPLSSFISHRRVISLIEAVEEHSDADTRSKERAAAVGAATNVAPPLQLQQWAANPTSLR
jgi:superfamily I DNA/RNA helicase